MPPTTSSKIRKRRAPKRVFGLELVRTPRRQPKIAGQPPERSQGIALLMVLTLLVLATTIIIELQFDSRVQLQLAANSRNSLQAEYLARSALQFTHLLLAFNSQFIRLKGRFKRFLKMLPSEAQMILNRLQIWKMVPLNSDMLKQLVGGAFGDARKESKGGSKKDPGKLYAFGDFKGRFSATMSDESAKINLNRFININDAKALQKQLMFMFIPQKYDPLFQNERQGVRMSRKEQVAAIQDWVDRDSRAYGSSDSEDGKYRYQEKGYFSKNYYFYSLEELRLVRGVDDLFFRTFAKNFTVYGPRQRININEAPEEVMRALVMTYAKMKPQEAGIFLTPQFKIFMREMMRYRSFMGFNSRKEFVRWCATPVVLDPRLFSGAGAGNVQSSGGAVQNMPRIKLDTRRMDKDSLTLESHADTFRISAVGHVGNVKRRITAVIHVQSRGKRNFYYWRLH